MEEKQMNNIKEMFESLKDELVKSLPEGTEPEIVIADGSPLNGLMLAVEELAKENESLKEQKLMAVADNQNTVRRFQTESMNIKKYGGEKIASEILPAIDTFRKVLQSTPDNTEIKNYLMGFEMIINQMDQGLANAGVTLIQTKVGDDFSAEEHSAVEEVETEAVASGKISSVISNGYKLHDRVIKHAIVKVAK